MHSSPRVHSADRAQNWAEAVVAVCGYGWQWPPVGTAWHSVVAVSPFLTPQQTSPVGHSHSSEHWIVTSVAELQVPPSSLLKQRPASDSVRQQIFVCRS